MRAWIEGLARTGYAARGLVYLVIGFFAVLAAFGGCARPAAPKRRARRRARSCSAVESWVESLVLVAKRPARELARGCLRPPRREAVAIIRHACDVRCASTAS